MTHNNKAKAVFLSALEQTSPGLRLAFLDAACRGDDALRVEVEALLHHHQQIEGFLDTPVIENVQTSDFIPTPSSRGKDCANQFIGSYRLIRIIGEGGMGIVYLAEQEKPIRRYVALKVIKPGMDTREVLARFEAERQALALMDHPGIARVFDAGTDQAGRPYFVMELIQGMAITKFCDNGQFSIRERLALFVLVCQAIQHAHTKGIIHRDIKPSNVLVDRCDGKTTPKVIDFGIAKATQRRLLDQSIYTELGALVGTLEYMSPEQAQLNSLDVDTRSDVYSLGAMLYELLTGSTPLKRQDLRSDGYEALLKRIREVDPPRPSDRVLATQPANSIVAQNRKTETSKLARMLRTDLDWITMKALEKDRGRRYESPSALASDVERYLAGDAVLACPPSAWYTLRKVGRKYSKPLLAAGLFFLLLVTAAAVSISLAVWARHAEALAIDSKKQVQQQRDQAQRKLTLEAVRNLESNLQQLEIIARALASLPQSDDWQGNEKDVERWIRNMLKDDDRIFGMTVALTQSDYCMYVCRNPKEISTAGALALLTSPHAPSVLLSISMLCAGSDPFQKMHLHAASPDYKYRERDWYKTAVTSGVSQWTPRPENFNAGGQTVPLIGYLMPIWRKNARTGRNDLVSVVTVDLSIGAFFKSEKLRGWMNELELGQHGQSSYGFVISHTQKQWEGDTTRGSLISHPDPDTRYQFPQVLPQANATAPFTAVVGQILDGKAGRETATDPRTGKRSTFLFAPVPSVEWTIVAVIEETPLPS